MILQLNYLDILPKLEADFEQAFAVAAKCLTCAEGYEGHSLRRSMDTPGRYLLLVHWRHLEDHTVTFRRAPAHITWKHLLDPFYAVRPQSVHFEELPQN